MNTAQLIEKVLTEYEVDVDTLLKQVSCIKLLEK